MTTSISGVKHRCTWHTGKRHGVFGDKAMLSMSSMLFPHCFSLSFYFKKAHALAHSQLPGSATRVSNSSVLLVLEALVAYVIYIYILCVV